MTDINWDDMGTSLFMKFEKVGDTISGFITAVKPGTDFNGNPCPVLELMTDDGERVLSCGQANLKAQIVAIRPKAGDSIVVTFDHEEKAAQGMKKVFVVDHKPGGMSPVTEAEKPLNIAADDEAPF